MEIGVHLPSAQSGANASDVLAVARAAERAEFDTVWMFDHLFTPTDLGSSYPYSRDGSYPLSPQDPFFDPLAVFGVLAGATERIKLGTIVLIAAYRHPIVLAKALASIENFAPGRLILGVGAGWMREEFDALGVSPRRRGDRLVEYVQALRAIWSEGPTDFRGDFYSFPEGGFLPAPTAPIPIIFGGHSDAALRRAAQHGDGWAIATARGQGSGIDAVARRLEGAEGLPRRGRPPQGFPSRLSERPVVLRPHERQASPHRPPSRDRRLVGPPL
ncbi:MAG: TIGR03619 family F420-dependent LLM class oxidoreductase [Actinomycetota bacterium]